MRRWWPVVAVAALVLAGCTDDGPESGAKTPSSVAATAAGTAKVGDAPPTTEPTTEPTKKPTKKPTTEPAPAAGSFVDVVREKLPEIAADRRDEEIQAIADTACAELGAGKKADAIVAGTRSLGTLDAEATDQATARELIKLAIDTTCPDQSRRVDEF